GPRQQISRRNEAGLRSGYMAAVHRAPDGGPLGHADGDDVTVSPRLPGRGLGRVPGSARTARFRAWVVAGWRLWLVLARAGRPGRDRRNRDPRTEWSGSAGRPVWRRTRGAG